MSVVLAASVALLGVAGAIGHSVVSERAILGPLFAGERVGILKSRANRAIIRAVFHLPSITWAALGIGVLVGRLQGGDPLLSIVAAIVFACSGIGNVVALRRPFIGGLVLVAAATLTLADLLL
jgi:hypothetical protein